MQKRAPKKQKNNQKQSNNGSIRIIAGKHRGRKLPVIMADGLRPTTDRVKETVFNWLMPYVANSHCLDCFAGAGSLGFEAYSRGASSVTLIELNKQAAKQLTNNKLLLNATELTVINNNTVEWLKNKAINQYDLVFIDPPFRQGLAEQVSTELQNGWLAEGAIIYLETEVEDQATWLPDNWQLLKEKVAGQVCYRLLQVA